MGFISYAQNFEDALLNRALGGQSIGFYLDVGAGHPSHGSVTRAFYERGWSGINVEPGPWFDELAAARPRDINLRMAVLDYKGTASFLSTPSDVGMSHVADSPDADGAESVPCDTLEAIIAEHARGRPIDFIKIDVEGAELAIIRSTDWRKVRPRLLVVEATLPWSTVLANDEWEPMLEAGGFRRMYFDGINCFYAPEEMAEALAPHFKVPVSCLDGDRFQHAVPILVEARNVALADLDRERAAHNATKAQIERLGAEHKAARDAVSAELEKERAALQTAMTSIGRLSAEQDAGHEATAAEIVQLNALHVAASSELERERLALAAAKAEIARLDAEQKTAREAISAELERERLALAAAKAEIARLGAEQKAAREATSAELERERAALRIATAEIERLGADHSGAGEAALAELERERAALQTAKSEIGQLEAELIMSREAVLAELERERSALQAAKEEIARLNMEHAAAFRSLSSEIRAGLATSSSIERLTAENVELAAIRRERDNLQRAYDAMVRRCDRLAGESAAHRFDIDRQLRTSPAASSAASINSPEILAGLAQVTAMLDRLLHLPAEVSALRGMLAEGGAAVDMLRSLTADMERTLLTLALENTAEIPAGDAPIRNGGTYDIPAQREPK